MTNPARCAALTTVVLLLALAGCGYQTAGRAVRLPDTLHTLYIPAFINQTQTYRVEQVLTAAVIREFHTRTRYRITQQEGEAADATLRGVVLSTQLAPVTYDSETARASSGLVTVHMSVTLVDKSGRVLWENPNYLFREQYQVTREVSSFFEEESPALERLSREFARTLVASILEAF
jgi:hypothetical protein